MSKKQNGEVWLKECAWVAFHVGSSRQLEVWGTGEFKVFKILEIWRIEPFEVWRIVGSKVSSEEEGWGGKKSWAWVVHCQPGCPTYLSTWGNNQVKVKVTQLSLSPQILISLIRRPDSRDFSRYIRNASNRCGPTRGPTSTWELTWATCYLR